MKVSGVRFQRETVGGIIDDILPLAKKHYQEVSHYSDIPLELDYQKFYALEKINALFIFSIRAQDRALIGYAVFFADKHVHYASKHAHSDAIFILPEYRGELGRKFVDWCDQEMKKEGVSLVYHSVTPKKDFSKMLKKLGYELHETIYTRKLS